jgi:hypothetical protein
MGGGSPIKRYPSDAVCAVAGIQNSKDIIIYFNIAFSYFGDPDRTRTCDLLL